MEHISEILNRIQATNTENNPTTTLSNANDEHPSPGENCPSCKGAGFVHPRLPSGKPDYSRVVPCRCVKQELTRDNLDRIQRFSNLGPLTRLTFENFIPEGRSGNPSSQAQFRHIYEIARAFAEKPVGWLVLTGASGSGKTHLAAAIANERLKQGNPVFFTTAPDLLDHLRSTFSPDSEMPYDELFEQVRKTPLLVLDDLGVQSSTPWAQEKLDQLLNYRFNSELPTVVVAIVPVSELDERLHTRLTDSRLCRVLVLEERPTPLLEYEWGRGLELQKNMTFSNFDSKRANLLPEQRENLREAYRVAMDFAKSPEGWLVLQGVVGCGKTHLAAAIVNYRYQANQPALFMVVPDFLDHLRSTFSPESKISYDQLFEKVKNVPLLVLDDFSEESSTPWAQEKLYQVINYRYNARLPTVITTSCSLNQIERRIASRLIDPKLTVFFNILAPDYRGNQPTEPEGRFPRKRAR
ncbi:MAG: ATP-binding protein [Chloroflexi bacterium]|nr:ATP-binding protein [Chloroflexota bacterium]